MNLAPGARPSPRPSPRSARPTSGHGVDRRQARGNAGPTSRRHAVPAVARRWPSLPPKVIDVTGRPGPGRAEGARRQARRAATRRLSQSGSRRCCATCSRPTRRSSGSSGGQPVSEADLEALDLAGADPGPDARPERPGRLLPRLRRASRPGDPRHHRPGRRGGARAVHRLRPAAPDLDSPQIRFLDLLQNHIAKYGSIEVARLYEPPFTTLHTDSIDGLFPDEEQAHRIIEIIESFRHRKGRRLQADVKKKKKRKKKPEPPWHDHEKYA